VDWGISLVPNEKSVRKIPLQRYWTTRYAITLAIGLLIVTIFSAWWIRHSALQDRLQLMEVMADEIANEVVSGRPNSERDLSDVDVRELLSNPGKYMNMKSNPSILITNVDGDMLYQNSQANQVSIQLNPSILMEEAAVTKLDVTGNSEDMYLVKKPITVNQTLLGWVVLLEWKGHLQEVNQEYRQLFIMVAAVAVFGWLAIYFISRRLARPITEVAKAAEQIKEGNYDITLKEDVAEKEVYELIHGFKEMSQRLHQLETLRTELLAGVTHELKTPVTSISGLIQAVNDGVVTGEEAKEFLQISLDEATKMEKMVEDLLAFNAFATNSLPLTLEKESINDMIKTCMEQWNMMKENEHVQVNLSLLKDDVEVMVDPIRIEQIIVNLCNNAKDAQNDEAVISVVLQEENEHILMDVIDQGTGIPEAEQPFIFERFYRGKEKQAKTSGFGLGLAFSKLIAQAHHGDLQLVQSSKKGTTFRLLLPKSVSEKR